MRLLSRAAAAASRRLGRPEILAAVDTHARQAQLEAVGVQVALATALRGGGIYVDVGTNRGQVLREALRVAPNARHVAFEPIPALAASIARDFPTVDCRPRALAATAGTAEFCHFTKLDGWSGLRRSPAISDERGAPEYITVEVSTLDDELADLAPSVVKVDVEGAELAVLQGGSGLLQDTRPLLIVEHVAEATALYGASSEALWDLLSDVGYEIYAASGEGPFTRSAFAHGGVVVNWLAAPLAATRAHAS
jgi:FkbM family methyltransferase